MNQAAVGRRIVQQIHHPVILHRQRRRHAARDPARQNQIKILIRSERSVRVVRAPGHLAKTFVEVSNEMGRIGVRRFLRVDLAQSQLLHEPVLQS